MIVIVSVCVKIGHGLVLLVNDVGLFVELENSYQSNESNDSYQSCCFWSNFRSLWSSCNRSPSKYTVCIRGSENGVLDPAYV